MAKEGFETREEFLEHAQSEAGGYYKRAAHPDIVVEFIRPCSDEPHGYYMRVRRIDTGAKLNLDFLDLIPIPEMELLALVIENEDKKQAALEAQERALAKAKKFDIIERLFGPD